MKSRQVLSAGAYTALTLAGAAIIAHAGPLNPPAGPVAPTYKTLAEIEPRIIINTTNTPGDGDSVCKITQPGNYYLTGDLVGQPGKHGIEVEASHVTIDLNGFQVRGAAGSLSGIDGNGTGPGSPTSAGYITLKNGVVMGWGVDGATANNAGAWVVEEVKFASNSGYGITVNSGTVFTRCYFYANGLDGCGTSNHVEFYYCFASLNGGNGFAAGSDSQFVHCEAGSNGGSGFVVPLGGRAIGCTSTLNDAGIVLGDGGAADNCHVDMNRNEGIIVGKGGTVSRCAVDGNGTAGAFHGIYARLFTSATVTTATITDCIVTSNTGYGIRTAGGSVRGCMTEANGGGGIYLSDRGVVAQCTAKGNTGVGITGGQSVAIIDCSSGANTTHGIQVFDDCLVRGNTCDSNGSAVTNGAGIYISNQTIPIGTNSDNRIEGNNVSDNDVGIGIDDSGNIVVRNTASGNATNWVIAALNKVAPIVLAPDSVAISGDTGGAGVGTTNPWSNLTY
jgi:parallel beta-helix repeat protein